MPPRSARIQKQKNKSKVALGLKVGAGLAVPIVLGGMALSNHKARQPQTWWDHNPTAAQAAIKGNSHLHDKAFLRTFLAQHHDGKAQSAILIKHWDNIISIADTGKRGARKYNPLTVLDTLSRVRDPSTEIYKIDQSTNFRNQAEAMRQYRRRELFRRVQVIPGHKKMMEDLFNLDSATIRKAKTIVYGTKEGSWKYGAFKQMPKRSEPPKSQAKKKEKYKPTKRERIMVAKARR